MHITRVELENIKSHKNASFEFQRGTTAITGANGAGKTTIIEAVAWTLFDLLDYKKDDFARRGSRNKGVARVTFESSLDEREYTVYRDTATGYYVYDNGLKTRIAEKKDEVARFLWQHLGVEAGTDLEALFRRAIGVPQGTFTAIFLETPTERKKAFDKLLKVEEYRQGAEKLRETVSFVRNQITTAREKIARAEGELMRLETIETEHRTIAGQIANLSGELEKLEKEAAEKRDAVKNLDEIETRVSELKTRRDRLQSELNTAEVVRGQKESELTRAREAAEKIKSIEADYQTHLAALAKLKELETGRSERERLSRERQQIETAAINVFADRKRLTENLEKAQNAQREIEILTPKIAEQELLENRRADFIEQMAQIRAKEDQIKSLDQKMNDLRAKFVRNKDQIKEIEARTATAADYERLQKRDSELTRDITRFRAKLEHDEQFQSEVRNGLCPVLSQKCLNLKAGETLESFLTSQFVELRTQISTLEGEQNSLMDALKIAREADKYSATLEALKSREAEISDEGKSYKAEKESLLKDVENKAKIQSDLTQADAELKALDNPKAKIRLLEAETKLETEIRQKLAEIEREIERLETEKGAATAKLEAFRDLDANWKTYSDKRDRTTTAHREFLANENAAKSLPEKTTEFEKSDAAVKSLGNDLAKSEEEFTAASQTYDRERHLSEKAALLETEKRLAETRATAEAAKRREGELSRELERLKMIRVSMQAEFHEKERLEKIGEATDFIRETLKEAAPRVARNYVYHVSLEANQMYREITGNAERTLKWTEDYGIVLEENGYDRPFVNLSGGEQMAAALSVRLALLKQLSDVRLAFFDEPTTNMDAARRENLATQIGNIKHFDQLFVISHDDTFEGYVDNVISVGAGGESESGD